MFSGPSTSTHAALWRLALIALAAFLGSTTKSAAQATNPNAAVKITLVSTNSLPQPGGRIMVIRRATGDPRTIIVLPEGASVADLAIAFGSLTKARAGDGDVLAHPEERIIAVGNVDTPLGAHQQRFANMLDQLARSRARSIKGLGTVRAFDISIHLVNVTPP